MKTYKIEVATREVELRGLDEKAKEDLTDIIRANEIRTNARLMKKGLISADEYLMEKQSVMGLSFASEPVVKYLTTPEGKRALLLAMLKTQDATEAEIAEMIAGMGDDETKAGAVFAIIFEEAYPKKKTAKTNPPDSTDPESPTSGEPSSATIPSGSTQPPSPA